MAIEAGPRLQVPRPLGGDYLCQEVGDMRLSAIAEVFGLASYASAGATIRQLKARIDRNAELGDMIQQLRRDLTS